ncbi:MAG: single-stranded DNA-binding protein [Thermodesulfobacteriota bacterium]
MGRNSVAFTGHAGRDAEVRYTPKGTQITSFSLAVNEGKDKPPLWLNIICFGYLADHAVDVAKGNLATVTGRLQIREYEDRDGNKRKVVEVVADTLVFQAMERQIQDTGHGKNRQGNQNQPDDYGDYGPPPSDDEIPF